MSAILRQNPRFESGKSRPVGGLVGSRYDATQETGAGFLSLALDKWSQHQGHMQQVVLNYTQTVTGQRMPAHAVDAWCLGRRFHGNDATLQMSYSW